MLYGAGANKTTIGSMLKYYDVLDSTNITAKELAEKGAEEGTIVQADEQKLGRGRLGRVWKSPAQSGLWFSIILRPKMEPQYGAQITLLTAVALVEAIKSATGIKTWIKWPNDILVKGKKIAGILSEMKLAEEGIDYIIIGIGLNVNIAKEDLGELLSETASSVYLETGKFYDRQLILEDFCISLKKWYEIWQRAGFKSVRERWLANNCTIGEFVKVKDNNKEIFAGIAKKIDDYGCLLVQSPKGTTKEFDFGEISIRS